MKKTASIKNVAPFLYPKLQPISSLRPNKTNLSLRGTAEFVYLPTGRTRSKILVGQYFTLQCKIQKFEENAKFNF